MRYEILILIFSYLFIRVGVSLLQKGKRYNLKGKAIKAVVVESNKWIDTDMNMVYHVTVKFSTKTEKDIIQKLPVPSKHPKRKGEKIEILYDANNPEYIREYYSNPIIILPKLSIAIGVLGFVFAGLKLLNII